MSIEVGPDALAETVAEFGYAYLLTLGPAPRPHVVAVHPTVADGAIHLHDLGRTSRRNIEHNGAVTLLWPPPEDGGHSLIVDGHATHRTDGTVVAPERAVLHRSAPSPPEPADGACAADCVEIAVPDVRSSGPRIVQGERVPEGG